MLPPREQPQRPVPQRRNPRFLITAHQGTPEMVVLAKAGTQWLSDVSGFPPSRE
jgi:hypothetical protein